MQSMTKELNLAHQIQATKSQCQQTLQQIQSVQHLFENVGDMTQIGLLEAIDSAILYIDENPPPEDDLAHKARKLYSTMERFLWELAMSAEHLAVTEARKRAHFSLRREDLIQEGYIGLLEAAKRFDASKQIRFTTYARWWVRAQMNRAQEKTGRLIRLPGGAVEQTRNLKEVLNQFSVEAQGISIEEAANIVGISHRRASLLLQQDSTISPSLRRED